MTLGLSVWSLPWILLIAWARCAAQAVVGTWHLGPRVGSQDGAPCPLVAANPQSCRKLKSRCSATAIARRPRMITVTSPRPCSARRGRLQTVRSPTLVKVTVVALWCVRTLMEHGVCTEPHLGVWAAQTGGTLAFGHAFTKFLGGFKTPWRELAQRVLRVQAHLLDLGRSILGFLVKARALHSRPLEAGRGSVPGGGSHAGGASLRSRQCGNIA